MEPCVSDERYQRKIVEEFVFTAIVPLLRLDLHIMFGLHILYNVVGPGHCIVYCRLSIYPQRERLYISRRVL